MIMDESTNSGSVAAEELEVEIRNVQGMHARPAAQFVRVASQYPGVELTVVKEALSVNGKSIIGIMMLEAGPGTRLLLRASGQGADGLLEDLRQLIESGFGEELAS